MNRRQPRDIAASIRARLLARSRETGDDFQFLLQRYASERFLYRLGESPHHGHPDCDPPGYSTIRKYLPNPGK
jgi:hypothetical protein